MAEASTRRRLRRVLAAAFLSLVILSVIEPAAAHRPRRYWQYEHRMSAHRNWWNHRWLRVRHTRWHRAHLAPAHAAHRRFHHRLLRHAHRRRHHFHRAISEQGGRASWYDYRGQIGACGVRLRGLYAAHRSWPCGSLVAVRRGNRYIHVRVLDRGPFVGGWIIDLAPAAFRRLGPLGAGVLDVKAYRLRR